MKTLAEIKPLGDYIQNALVEKWWVFAILAALIILKVVSFFKTINKFAREMPLISSARMHSILFCLSKYHAILGNVKEAKNLVRRVFKIDGSSKADFLDDPEFDSVWESF